MYVLHRESSTKSSTICCRFVLLLVMLGVCPPQLTAQNFIETPREADSLRRLITTAKHDTTRINAMNELAEYFRRVKSRYDSAMTLAQDAHKKAKIINHQVGVAFALRNIGAIYYNLGRYGISLEYLLQSVRISEAIGYKYGVGLSFNYIANDLSEQKKESEAITYYLRSLQIFEEIQNKRGMGIVLGNVGELLTLQGKLQEAMQYNFKALQINQEIDNQRSIGYTFSSMGKVYSLQGDYNKAMEYHLKGLAIQEVINNKYGIIFQLNHLAETLQRQGQYQSSMQHLLRALAMADSIGYALEKKRSLFLLSQGCDILREYRQSLAYHRQYMKIQDSLISLETLNKTAQLKESYEAEKRAQQIALQESEIAHRNVIQWSLTGILAAVVTGAVWLGALYRQKNTANKAILQQQQLMEEQDKEIQEANIELRQQNEELAALNNEKNELMGIVSHDLKNPIGAVRTFAELIQNQTFTGAEVLSVSGQIVQVSDRMLELVKNLLDLNHLESGGLQLHILNFDVVPLVESVVTQYRTPAEAKNITLHFSNETDGGESIVSADERAMMQVLDNLVSNAVKYSPHGKNVFVRVLSNQAAVRIEVRDEGQGISPEDMKKLFGKFQRLSAVPTGGEHSTGLGLSIVKKIVEAMNGKVWCESELGDGLPTGATFIVELPHQNA